ncbi:uncharacterized protein LOC143294540 [Babylonia areolata]|uniref:uncharacterized protein LOC143294540 n=1 Tax=Babylonia areolata TaxID=304850 RepID=UPI003FD6A1BC
MSGAAQNQEAKSQPVHSDDIQSSAKSANTTASTDDATAAAAEGGSGDNQEEAPGGSERPAGSPEPNCAICLGQLENKSFTDSCFHMFCFVCLQEWSKVKAECPLCKQPFKSIIHNVKSYNNYDQFYLDHHQHRPPQPLHFGWNFDRSFRYRTTLTMDHRYFNIHSYSIQDRDSSAAPVYRRSLMPRYRLRSRTVHPLMRPYPEPVSTTRFRRQIYEWGRRVSGLRATHRKRRVSPEFFRNNPAQTHRLVPWLNRELNALLYNVEEQVTFVLELIMGLIKRFNIESEEFYEHIHPYLHHNTRHFMHEFLYFARSPYSMSTYDTKAIYEETSHTVPTSESSSGDSDVVVVDDDDDEPGADGSGVGREHTVRLSPWHSPQASVVSHSATSTMGRSHWDSPTPGPSWDLSGNSSQSPVNVDDSSSDASTIIDPTYIAPEVPASQPDSSDGEEVIIISYDKPWEERSPIQLSSGSDSETSHFVEALKQENNNRKARLSSSVSESNQQSRDGARDRSRSLTPPVSMLSGSHHSSSGSRDRHGSSANISSKTKRHHKRKHHHHDRSEETRHHSFRSSHKEKRKSSNSHGSVPSKKRRHDRSEKDRDLAESSSKHKHKKHKRPRDKHSKRQAEGHSVGDSPGTSETVASSASAERADHCKKHPSGHKKSRVKSAASDGQGAEAKEGSSGHQSDGLLSDTSSSSSNSTATTTSLTDMESASARYYSRQQRVQQVLQERHRQACLPLAPGLMEMPPSWENISRLASMLASHTSAQFAAMPSSSQSCTDPVVISTSSDESDTEVQPRKGGADHLTSDNMSVAKTVVVPCSSNPEVPTAAIDYASTLASTSSVQRLGVVDNFIDVECISSEDEASDKEVVDVESVDTESSSDAISTNIHKFLAKLKSAREAESEKDLLLPGTSSVKHSTESLDCTDEVQKPGRVLTDSRTPPSGVHTHAKGKSVKILSPHSMAAMKRKKTSKLLKSGKSASSSGNPFSMRIILNEDAFMDSEGLPEVLPTQASAAQSSFDSPVPAQDLTHSHLQYAGAAEEETTNQQPAVIFSRFSQYGSHPQQYAMQAPVPSAVSCHGQESRSLPVSSGGNTEGVSVLSVSSQHTESKPLPFSQRAHASSSPSLSVSQQKTDNCSLSSASHAGSSPIIIQESPECPRDGNCDQGQETKISDEEGNCVEKSSGSHCSDTLTDLNDSSLSGYLTAGIGHMSPIFDKEIDVLNDSFHNEDKEIDVLNDSVENEDKEIDVLNVSILSDDKEIDVLNDSIHGNDLPASKSHENETEGASVKESPHNVEEPPEHKISQDEVMLLHSSHSTDVEEEVELCLLSDENTCASSGQEERVKSFSNRFIIDMGVTVQKHTASDSACLRSEANTCSIADGDVSKIPHHSSSAQIKSTSTTAELAISESTTCVTKSVPGSAGNVDCSSSDL